MSYPTIEGVAGTVQAVPGSCDGKPYAQILNGELVPMYKVICQGNVVDVISYNNSYWIVQPVGMSASSSAQQQSAAVNQVPIPQQSNLASVSLGNSTSVPVTTNQVGSLPLSSDQKLAGPVPTGLGSVSLPSSLPTYTPAVAQVPVPVAASTPAPNFNTQLPPLQSRTSNNPVFQTVKLRDPSLTDYQQAVTVLNSDISFLEAEYQKLKFEFNRISALNQADVKTASEANALLTKFGYVPKSGDTQLMVAAAQGQMRLVQYLIRFGGCKETINDKNKNKKMAAQLAAENGHTEVTEYLLLQGAECSANSSGNTLLHIACQRGHVDLARVLISMPLFKAKTKNKHGHSALLTAAAHDQVDVVRYIVTNDVSKVLEDVSGVDSIEKKAGGGGGGGLFGIFSSSGNTPPQFAFPSEGMNALHVASAYGSTKTLNFLLSAQGKVDINTATSSGKITALHFAGFRGKIESLTTLLSHKVPVATQVQSNGDTLAHCAALGGSEIFMKYLLDNSLYDRTPNSSGITPLLYAATYGNLPICRLLLTNDGITFASHKEADKNGNTVLHLAVKSGSAQLISYLVQQGASLNTINEKGETPLDWINASSMEEVVNLRTKEKHKLLPPQAPGVLPPSVQ